jgi:hypothetical protein
MDYPISKGPEKATPICNSYSAIGLKYQEIWGRTDQCFVSQDLGNVGADRVQLPGTLTDMITLLVIAKQSLCKGFSVEHFSEVIY